MLGWLLVIGIAIYLFSQAKIKALASAGNPNNPPSQSGMVPLSYAGSVGPQGPNDGSNNPSGSGHTITPDGTTGPVSQIISRGFKYVNDAFQYQDSGGNQSVY